MLAHLRNRARFAPLVDHSVIVKHGKAQALGRVRTGVRLAPFHQRAQLADEPRVAERRAAQHHAVDAAGAHLRERIARIAEIAVADHRNVDRAFERRDVRPIRLAPVELLRGARMQRHGLDAHVLRALRDVDVDEIRFRPAEPHLHRDGTVDGRDDGAHDRLAPAGVAQTRAPALGFRHLGRRTAEIDVDDVGAAFAHQPRRLRHDLRIVAP